LIIYTLSGQIFAWHTHGVGGRRQGQGSCLNLGVAIASYAYSCSSCQHSVQNVQTIQHLHLLGRSAALFDFDTHSSAQVLRKVRKLHIPEQSAEALKGMKLRHDSFCFVFEAQFVLVAKTLQWPCTCVKPRPKMGLPTSKRGISCQHFLKLTPV